MVKLFVMGLVFGIMVAGFTVAIAWLTGSTFGQRCEKAYPNNPLEYERCVYEMAKGLRDYPLQEKRP